MVAVVAILGVRDDGKRVDADLPGLAEEFGNLLLQTLLLCVKLIAVCFQR